MPAQDVDELAREKRKILVVNDDEGVAEVFAALLMAEGYFVETATNGDVAFEIYSQYLAEGISFDFVLTGLSQPGMNGVTLVENILQKNPAQRFGFSTAHRVLTVPFERDQLLSFVKVGS